MYKIPKEIKTDIKVTSFLYMKDIAIIVGVFFLLQTFSDSVHTAMKIPYYLIFGGFTFFMLLPSIKNPKKRNYHSLMFVLRRDQDFYHPISRESIDSSNEEGSNQ